MKKILLIAYILISSVSFSIIIARDVVTDAVENREPTNEMTEFNAYSKAFYFMEAKDIGEETYVYHVWSYIKEDGSPKEMARVKLKVKGTRWRTWSTKNLWIEGTWLVEIIDMDGNFLSGKEFEVVGKVEEDTMN